MSDSNRNDISILVARISEGDQDALDALMPVVYSELREIAERVMNRERPDHTLSPTALVHETYLKLAANDNIPLKNRPHFMAVAARAMRQVLVDYARIHAAKKRGGGKLNVTFDEAVHSQPMNAENILLLDKALAELKALNDRQAVIVECWFFGGLTHQEIADAQGISLTTLRRDWRLARAWLATQIRPDLLG